VLTVTTNAAGKQKMPSLHVVKTTQSVDKDLTQLMTSWICGLSVQNLVNVATEGTVEIFNNLHYKWGALWLSACELVWTH